MRPLRHAARRHYRSASVILPERTADQQHAICVGISNRGLDESQGIQADRAGWTRRTGSRTERPWLNRPKFP